MKTKKTHKQTTLGYSYFDKDGFQVTIKKTYDFHTITPALKQEFIDHVEKVSRNKFVPDKFQINKQAKTLFE